MATLTENDPSQPGGAETVCQMEISVFMTPVSDSTDLCLQSKHTAGDRPQCDTGVAGNAAGFIAYAKRHSLVGFMFHFSMKNARQSELILFYSDRETSRPEPVDFRYWKTPEKTPPVLHQVRLTVFRKH